MTSLNGTHRRVEVLDLRIRLERVAASAFDHVCLPSERHVQRQIESRLTFVLAIVPEGRMSEVLGLIRLGRHVYAKTSDVLHGRSTMVDVPPVVIDEWRAVVQGLESIVNHTLALDDREDVEKLE